MATPDTARRHSRRRTAVTVTGAGLAVLAAGAIGLATTASAGVTAAAAPTGKVG